MNSTLIAKIDAASMLRPPLPKDWHPTDAEPPRFGWDESYIKNFGQKFSPWYFARNSAAVLGHVRTHGASQLMANMADHLVMIASPHIESIGPYRYVRNDFAFGYLWHKMKPPFYGAFMNAMTAYGLLHLYEATKVERYLLLADRLLMTSAADGAPIPLCSLGDDFWLHEYVFQCDTEASIALRKSGRWNLARIFNGHIHALLAFLRFRAMTGASDYDTAIDLATRTMARWLQSQPYQDTYFSYSPDMPIYPDYGQHRAYHLATSLAQITGDPMICAASDTATTLWAAIEGKEKEIIKSGVAKAKQAYDAMIQPIR